MASQDVRLSKFKADFKQQQSEMTNKIDTVLKAITDQITRALPSDTVKYPKLTINFTALVFSARSYPTEDPECSTRIHSSINVITICPKQPDISRNNNPRGEEQEENDNPENINTNPSSLPDPSVSFELLSPKNRHNPIILLYSAPTQEFEDGRTRGKLSKTSLEVMRRQNRSLEKVGVIIQQDFDNLEAELQKAHARIAKLQRKQMGNNNKIALARFRIANLEQIIEEIQVRHQADKESLLNAIYELKNSQKGPSNY
ncbi:hypothetical protein Tco_1153443 [Tanacetum coccineum]